MAHLEWAAAVGRRSNRHAQRVPAGFEFERHHVVNGIPRHSRQALRKHQIAIRGARGPVAVLRQFAEHSQAGNQANHCWPRADRLNHRRRSERDSRAADGDVRRDVCRPPEDTALSVVDATVASPGGKGALADVSTSGLARIASRLPEAHPGATTASARRRIEETRTPL